MKTLKKLTNVFVAVFVFLALCVNVHAADTYTITINNKATGHTYEAYQIFAGDLSKDKMKLSNITWGTGVTDAGKTALGEAASKAELIKTAEDAKAFAKVIAEYLTDTKVDSVYDATNKNYKISNLAPGYYLIKDKDASITGDDTYTGYILEVVKDVTTEPKGDKPEVEKKVDDKNDSNTTEDETNWEDSADYDIGDTVPFQLTGTLPSNYADYYYYTYIFHDTLSKGLTYNDNAQVYVVNGENEINVTESFVITPVANVDGTTSLTISCTDLKAITKATITSSSTIVVRYTATLDEDAVIGATGNPNEVYLEYSNNPNNTGEGDNTTGNTPEDKVIVFTFKTIVNKVDEKGEPLTGAEFKLFKFEANANGSETYKGVKGNWVEKTLSVNDDGTVFTLEGLDAGEYKLVESKTPDGYNTIDDIYFTVEATHDETAADPKLLTLVVKDADGNIIGTSDPESGETYEWTVILNDGSMTTDIVNKSGIELPGTGGIGTTIFYVVGGGLMLVAGVLLITKKKMSEHK